MAHEEGAEQAACLTAERARAIFRYDHETGELFRRLRNGGERVITTLAGNGYVVVGRGRQQQVDQAVF